MTVGELIEMLEIHDENLPVVHTVPLGMGDEEMMEIVYVWGEDEKYTTDEDDIKEGPVVLLL